MLTNIRLVPINPAAFGYCEGWVLLAAEGGREIAVETFGQHQRAAAVKAFETQQRMARVAATCNGGH